MEHLPYRDILLNMPLACGVFRVVTDVCGTPVDCEFVEVNAKFEELTGLCNPEISGRRVSEVAQETIGDSLGWICSCMPAALGGGPLEFERRFGDPGRWYRVSAFCPAEGYFVALLADLTREKDKLDEALRREGDAKFHFDGAPFGIATVSGSGRILEVNPAACKMTGYTADELLQMNSQMLVEKSSRIFAFMFFKDIVSNGHAECQLQIRTKSGFLRWLAVTGRPAGDGNFALYCTDVTPYKELESDLVESELLYRTFFNASHDMIYLKDENLRYMIVNSALLDQFGCESQEIIGKTDFEALPEEFALKTESSDIEAIRTRSSYVSEMAIGGKIFQAVKFPVPIGRKRTGVGAYIRDITAEKRREEILKRTVDRHRILSNALLMTFSSSQEQLEYALKEALTLTGSRYGAIFLCDEERREMRLSNWTDGAMEAFGLDSLMRPLGLEGAGLWGEAVRARRPVVINDCPALKSVWKSGSVPLERFMSIPVVINGRVVAAVALANKQTDYDELDVNELAMLISGVWVAVEKKNVQERMENLLEQTQAMFNEHDAVMLLTHPETGRIIDANPAAVSFYGYTKEELLNLRIDDINMLPASDLSGQSTGGKLKLYSHPHRLKNGEKRLVDVYSCPITYNNEKVLFSIIFDVTEREAAFAEIKYLSYHDHLTGLYNRRYFDNVLKLMNDERFMPLTIVMADVNGLKLVNDSFGHSEGDELLKKAAEIISEGIRKDDISARIGGDEFVIILPNTDGSEAAKVVRRIKRLQSKIRVKQLDLSMSFGYAVKHDVSSDIDLVVSEAENNMYKNKIHESANTRNKTVSIILNALYDKCIGELEHSHRVSRIASAIAAEMGLPAEQVNQIGVAGLLHDIGKIGVDESVLNKAGIFTKADWDEIHKHPESGWRILSNSDEYAALADYVLYHHESVDGKGYPRGIRGGSIPLESKIIAVSDAYDAMTNDRPYRKAMSREEAIAELRRNAGTQFDPEVVSVFIDRVLSREDCDF